MHVSEALTGSNSILPASTQQECNIKSALVPHSASRSWPAWCGLRSQHLPETDARIPPQPAGVAPLRECADDKRNRDVPYSRDSKTPWPAFLLCWHIARWLYRSCQHLGQRRTCATDEQAERDDCRCQARFGGSWRDFYSDRQLPSFLDHLTQQSCGRYQAHICPSGRAVIGRFPYEWTGKQREGPFVLTGIQGRKTKSASVASSSTSNVQLRIRAKRREAIQRYAVGMVSTNSSEESWTATVESMMPTASGRQASSAAMINDAIKLCTTLPTKSITVSPTKTTSLESLSFTQSVVNAAG